MTQTERRALQFIRDKTRVAPSEIVDFLFPGVVAPSSYFQRFFDALRAKGWVESFWFGHGELQLTDEGKEALEEET